MEPRQPALCTFSSFTVLNSHGIPSGFVSPPPTFVPVFVERSQSGTPVVNLTPPPTYPWSQPISSAQWPFTSTTNVVETVQNSYPIDLYPTDHAPPQSAEWFEYDHSSNSYDFYDPENVNLDTPLEEDASQQLESTYWDSLQEWAFDVWPEDEDDRNYPSKRLQQLAYDIFRTSRSRSAIVAGRESTTEIADARIWQNLTGKQTADAENTSRDDPSPSMQADASEPMESEIMQPKMDEEAKEEGIQIILPDVLPPIPPCETLLLPPDSNDGNTGCPPAPITYAAASTPRNTAETISAYMNRTLKMHLMAANAPLTEPFPMRHRNPKTTSTTIEPIKAPPVEPTPNPEPPLAVHGLDAMAALARRNSFSLRQLNGGLLLIPYCQDEHRYCIGASTAGKMVIGLEKLSPPRLYANDFRTICLKKVPYTEDCDKVWCRLNLFRKQIGAEKSAARRNNVAIYELFSLSEQFAYFGRLPYKWNLDEYLKSDHYNTTVTNCEKEGLRILRGLANGLAYVHRGDFRLFHGNLKPSNVLISSDGSVFLTDYGFGRICCPMWSGAAAHRFCRDLDTGTFDPLCWKAYEFFSGCSSLPMAMQNTHQSPTLSRETPHRQADVFSAALLGYYAITSGQSHPLINGDEAYRKTLHFYRQRIDRFADFVQLDEITDPNARHLIFSMLEVDVKHRPDARYVADHPVFWNEKKRNDFLVAVAEYVCANEKMMPHGFSTHPQSSTLLRVLATKKVASLSFAQRLNSTPETVAKIAARFGVKFEDASAGIALKTFYRQHRRVSNGGDKPTFNEEMEPLWNELAAEIYDVVYPSPPLKLKPFFTK